MKATLVHTARFDAEISALLDADEISELEFAIGCAPEAHPVVKDTGGVRKARWARQGRGKSGGIRVIYFYVDHRGVVYLISAYPKNEKENLSADDKKAMRKLTKVLKDEN
jgi:mRNA-degrading endonuclease RelE of RelBE toxin-antitoxin system